MNAQSTIVILFLCMAALTTACTTEAAAKRTLRLTETPTEIRALQSRRFAVADSSTIFAAGIETLQDLEFNIDDMQPKLGLLTASKVADADVPGEETGLGVLMVLCMLGGGSSCSTPGDALDNHVISISVVILPSLANTEEFVVRITAQSALIDKNGNIRKLERIEDAETYQKVFERFRRSIYLEEAI